VHLYPLLLLAVFTIFMAYPLVSVLIRAVWVDNEITLHFFKLMVTTESLREVLFNSLNLAITVTLISGLIGYVLAFVMSRYPIPLAMPLHTLLLLPLIAAPFVGVLGVRQLFSRFGSLNLLLLDLGLLHSPIDWLGGGGVLGIVALQTIHLVPVMYLTVSASLKNTRVTLEEAAYMHGASKWRTIWRVVIPLSLPGVFAGAVLVFVASFTDLGTPLVFEYRSVIPVQIYDMLSDLHENRVGYAFVVFACILSTLLFLLAKGSLAGGNVGGTGRIAEPWRKELVPVWAQVMLMLLVAGYALVALLPQVAIAVIAVSDDWFMSILPSSFSLKNFHAVLQHRLTAHSLLRSIWLSSAAAALTVLLGVGTAFLIARGSRRNRVLFEVISVAPLAIPGIVFAFGYISAFSGTPLDNRINPFPLLIAAYAIRRLPSMVRSVSAGFQEASQSLEEAALMVGARPVRVAREIVLPLMKRHIIVGVMLTFAYSMIEVSDGILLALEEDFYPVSKAIYVLMSRPDGLELASSLGCIVMAIMVVAFAIAEFVSRPPRYLTKCLLLAACGCTLLSASPSHAADAAEEELVIVSAHWEGIKTEFERAFKAHWLETTGRPVRVRWLDIGGTSDIIKYVRGQLKNSPEGIGIDLIFGGGVDAFLELSRSNALQPANIDSTLLKAIPTQLAGSPLYSPKREWFAAALSTFGIVYNRVAVEKLGAIPPTKWSDLADPRYHSFLGAADPRKSGSMHAIYEVILQGYGWQRGWEILRAIGANVRIFSGSAIQVARDLGTAEIIYAVMIDTHAGDAIRQLGKERLEFVVPEDFRPINGDGIGLVRGAPNGRVATAFIEFVLSEKGQRLWYAKRGSPGGPKEFELGKLPVLPSIYGSMPSATLTSDSPFGWQHTLSYDAQRASNRWNLVNDLFGAFIIDVHDRLVAQARLGQPIGTVPISEAEADALGQGGSWGENSTVRSTYLNLWSGEARAEFEGQPQSIAVQYRWVPSAIFFAILLALFARRIARKI
jgi:iron(III) transport system permease protein